MADSVYGSAFYASTGLHGFHVIIGTIFIAVALIKIINYQLTTKDHNVLNLVLAFCRCCLVILICGCLFLG